LRRSDTGRLSVDLPVQGHDAIMRTGTLLLIVWLLVGGAAAFQRDYFRGHDVSCAKASTIVVTVAAGPLNYFGANPKVRCPSVAVPQPSR
jgi:hypothetical protein